MFARCLGIEGKVNIFLLLREAAELNVESVEFEFDAFHSGGGCVESIGEKVRRASDFVRLVAGIMRQHLNQF